MILSLLPIKKLTLSKPSMRLQKILFFVLTIIFWALTLYPYHNYQPLLAVGDHGWHFYCFQQTLEGKMPYKDFYWDYGPIMPYYYALCYKIFGINMASILWGRIILLLFSTGMFYLILAEIVAPFVAFVGACWFLNFSQDFMYTYNHTGGRVLTLGHFIVCSFICAIFKSNI